MSALLGRHVGLGKAYDSAVVVSGDASIGVETMDPSGNVYRFCMITAGTVEDGQLVEQDLAVTGYRGGYAKLSAATSGQQTMPFGLVDLRFEVAGTSVAASGACWVLVEGFHGGASGDAGVNQGDFLTGSATDGSLAGMVAYGAVSGAKPLGVALADVSVGKVPVRFFRQGF